MDDFFMREGWLQKRGVEGLKSWSKRYFTLEDEELYYYENKGDVAPKGRILVTDIQRVDSVSGSFWSRGYYFNVVTPDRTYELCADEDNDRKEWISILQRASAHFKKMAKEMHQQPVNTKGSNDATDMNDEDEENVELTEEDMNDPDLLGELTELHGKEGLIEHSKELSVKIDSEKQKCIQLRDAGKIEDAKKLLLKIKNLQNQKEALELKIQNYDKQEEMEEPEEALEEPQQEEEPVVEEEEEEPSHDDTKSSATEESLVEVERRIEGFKNLALNAKKQGNLAQATQYMKSYKVLLQAKEQLDVGIQMDLSKLPNLDPATPLTTTTTTTPSVPATSSRPKSNSITPPPTKNVEAERLEALSILEEELRRQYEVAKSKALAAKNNNDKHTALEQLNITKDVKHHLEEIIKAKSLPHVPVPKYHFETKEHTVEKKHDDLLDNEIEISITNCKGIKDAAITSPYFHVLFPYPNSEDPQKSSSSSFSPKSTDFQYTCKLTIERKKSFQIFCERKKILLELYQSRLLLSSTLLGKGEMKLSPLLEKCEMKETIEIKNGRKLVCVADVSVRLKRPVVKEKHVEKVVEKVLVIDEHYTSAPPSTNETPVETPKAPAPKIPEPKKEPEPKEETTPSEEDYLSVDYLISNDVLEFERDMLAAKISALKGQAPDELVDRKQAVELKLQILSVQASTGQLDQEKYIQDMKDKIVVEKRLAGKLSKEGNKDAALMALKRVKIMEKEIEASME